MLIRMRRLLALTILAAATLSAPALSAPAQTPAADPLAPLDFLNGTWTAVTNAPAGTAGAASTGTYTFRRDLAGHAIDRTTSADSCHGPQDFDCAHHDRLTIFSDPNAFAVHHASLFAFYMDSEGHIIYYTVSLPDPQTAVFNSQAAPTAPKFRLTYHLEGTGPKAIMTGKFQMAAPGSDDYHSYLEWSGTRH
jgi:hypothetical protein